MTGLARAVRTVVRTCLAVAPGEDVLVVVDEPLQDVGEALRREAQDAQADAVLAVMSARENHGVEPPPTIAAALAACDVFIAPASRSLSHTQARKAATDNGARGATMPTVTADMLARLMDVDFEVLRARSRAVADLLSAADEAHVTCPRGTDLHLDLARPRGHRRRRRPHRAGRVRQPARAARASSRRPGERGRSPRARWPPSASSRATRRT